MHIYDLLVVGGGTAGVMSALAAARCGLKTAVVEKSMCLGGNMTMSGLTEMNAPTFHGRQIYRGIEGEMFSAMIRDGEAELYRDVPFSSNPSVRMDRLRYDPELLKIRLETMAVKAGISLWYGVTAVDASGSPGKEIRLVIQGENDTEELSAPFLIDATGSAAMIRQLGGTASRVEPGKTMVSSLIFRISGVDQEVLDSFIHSDALSEIIDRGINLGVLKGRILAFTPIPGTKDISLNVTRTNEDFESLDGRSRAMIETRSQILPIFHFVRENVPGLKHSWLSGIAPYVGVRDTRTIEGMYRLTIDDLEQRRDFVDCVADGCYPVDIHDPKTGKVIFQELPGIYHIPFGCLVPRGLHRTLAAGKILCCDRTAYGAVRVMPIMMNVGESAGYAAAFASNRNLDFDGIPGQELRAFLDQQYSEK